MPPAAGNALLKTALKRSVRPSVAPNAIMGTPPADSKPRSPPTRIASPIALSRLEPPHYPLKACWSIDVAILRISEASLCSTPGNAVRLPYLAPYVKPFDSSVWETDFAALEKFLSRSRAAQCVAITYAPDTLELRQ